jgi:hypothetical protein
VLPPRGTSSSAESCPHFCLSTVQSQSSLTNPNFFSRWQDGDCDFYEWQPLYAARSEVTGAIIARAAPVPGAAAAPPRAAPSSSTMQVAPPQPTMRSLNQISSKLRRGAFRKQALQQAPTQRNSPCPTSFLVSST